MKKFLKFISAVFLLAVFTTVALNLWVIWSTEGRVFTEQTDLPPADVGLVLGTSRYVVGGEKNMYFYNRLHAAVELYKSGKIKHILVSGDNRTKYYNEPKDMYEVLRKMGVPENAITLDFAGLRTLDSVVRSREIFGQQKIIIITQEFHSYRAVFLADKHGQKAFCYVAEDPPYHESSNTSSREFLARIKAVIDVYIFNEEPTHLGKKEPISI